MTLNGSASCCRGALVSVLLAVLSLAAPAASAQTVNPFTVSGVKVAASARSTNAARDLAMAQGRSIAWSELFRRLTAQDQWGNQPMLADNELSRLIPLSEVRNERRNTTRYLAEATFHFSQTEVERLLRRPSFGVTERSGNLRMITLTTGTTRILDRFTEINELKKLSSINYGIRAFLTADVRFDSLENWTKIRAQSALVTEISDFDLIGLSLHEAEIELSYWGPIEDLPQAMARQNLKLSNSAGHYTIELGNAATVANEPTEILAVPLLRRLLPPALPRAAAQ
jgi:hypothetical protein